MKSGGKTHVFRAVLIVVLLLLPAAGVALDFTDVTETAGVGDRGHGKGVAFADIDNDGDFDLYVSNKGGENVLYRNEGGVYIDISSRAGDRVGDPGLSMGSCFADYDNDGDLDLYFVKGGRYEIEANRLLRNDNGR
ncbi:MAG: VCBS repeat-containing protein, partial [bacterium]